ncbi:MAG: ribonuclease J [Candidatus Campbellbacteria bacterium]|nr:ribonuclease J [Candidatus Campbellbacteria bacterium]
MNETRDNRNRSSQRRNNGGHQNSGPRQNQNKNGRNQRNNNRNNKRGGSSNNRRNHRGNARGKFREQSASHIDRNHQKLSPIKDGDIRIIPLGGVEEVGRNMTAIETKDDILIIDAGFQFHDESTPGIDYVLPNITYLEENKDKIRGLVVTHGHLDHIGAIPYVMHRLGNPTIYSRQLTTVMIEKRQSEFPHQPKLNIRTVESNDSITLGNTKLNFYAVSHTIPEAMGIIVDTPYGSIVVTGDMKLDHVDGVPSDKEEKAYSIFKDRKVLALIADSTNVENPGWSIPEWRVHETLEKIIAETPGRLIIGTFASQMDRIVKIVEIAERHNKKIVVEGRSMKQNLEIIRHLNILQPKPGTFISNSEMSDYPPDKIVCLATGAQGDEFAALMRMAIKTHKQFKLTPRDTVLLSSSVIPGNENSVQKLKDNLARRGVKIIHYRVSDVHASGHANQEEAVWIHKQINPKFFVPVHGNHYMLNVHADMATTRLGMPKDNVVIPDNGSVIEISDNGEKIRKLKESVPHDPMMVDGFTIGTMHDVVIRDRKALSDDGMFVIVASINPKTGKLRKSPDIISRGFIYLRESQDLLHEARNIIKDTVEKTTQNMNPIDFDILKNDVSDKVGKFLYQKTAKQPIIIPVMIGV